jgi:hypothetical protein
MKVVCSTVYPIALHCNPKYPFYPKKMCLGETDN